MHNIIHHGITLDIHPDYSQFIGLHAKNLGEFRRHIALHGLGQAFVLYAMGYAVTGIYMPTLKDHSVCRIESAPAEVCDFEAINSTNTPLGQICQLLSGYVAESLFKGTDYGSVTSIDEWHAAYQLCELFGAKNEIPPHHVLTACVCAVESFLSEHESVINFAAQYLAEAEGQELLFRGRGGLLSGVPQQDLGNAAFENLKEGWLEEEYGRVERLMP